MCVYIYILCVCVCVFELLDVFGYLVLMWMKRCEQMCACVYIHIMFFAMCVCVCASLSSLRSLDT